MVVRLKNKVRKHFFSIFCVFSLNLCNNSDQTCFFQSFTFARSLGRCWKPRASPSVFNTCLGTLRMLMNGKSCLIPISIAKARAKTAVRAIRAPIMEILHPNPRSFIIRFFPREYGLFLVWIIFLVWWLELIHTGEKRIINREKKNAWCEPLQLQSYSGGDGAVGKEIY